MPEKCLAQGAILNRRHCLIGLLGLPGLALPGFAQAFRFEDQEFDDGLQMAGSELVLNGVGKRAEAFVRAYAAGLYMTARATTPETVLLVPGPKRLQIRMLLDLGRSIPIGINSVDAEEFVKAVNVGVARNCSEAERSALTERLPLFTQILHSIGKVKKRDLINIDYLPGQGTLVFVNDKQWGQAVPGADLYAALLKVFVGDLPIDKRLKAGLLGQSTS